jgi:hypothetical protein
LFTFAALTCTMLQLRRKFLQLPLLAAAPFTVARPASAAARLRPGTPSALALTPLPQERVAFRAAGLTGAIVVPAARARILAVLPLPDRDAVLLGFAADAPAGRLDLMAVVTWTPGGLAIAALDVLAWQAGGGAHLTTRVSATADRSGLALQRDAAAPRNRQVWQHESWTDHLDWQGRPPFADRPVRPPSWGSWQRVLANWRAQVITVLEHGCQDVSGALGALSVPPELLVG